MRLKKEIIGDKDFTVAQRYLTDAKNTIQKFLGIGFHKK
jgi:hypothetical protein